MTKTSELLSFRSNSLLEGHLNAKNPVWNSQVSNPSGEKLLELFDNSDFQISAPHYPTHYASQGTGDMLDIVLHKNV
jgi:predicted FMN-binding regulatory protein PaiB